MHTTQLAPLQVSGTTTSVAAPMLVSSQLLQHFVYGLLESSWAGLAQASNSYNCNVRCMHEILQLLTLTTAAVKCETSNDTYTCCQWNQACLNLTLTQGLQKCCGKSECVLFVPLAVPGQRAGRLCMGRTLLQSKLKCSLRRRLGGNFPATLCPHSNATRFF